MLSVDDITKKLIPIFEQNGVTKAILFGSYADGTATEESDVDIVVETEPHIRGLKFFGILGYVADALGMEVDLIPQRSIVPNSRVDMEVSQKGVVIYERER